MEYISRQFLSDYFDYFELIVVGFRNKFKPVFGRGHMTDGVITLNLILVVFYDRYYYHVVWHPAWYQIDKLGVCDFSGAKDSGKVLIIIKCYFCNYYYHY